MKFEELSLEQFKCYEEAAVRFEPGVTVVYGPNGSGKSTLLDACFFALYGSDTLADATLADVITTGEERAGLRLNFSHAGTQYEISRDLAMRGDRAQTTTCTLTGGDLEVDGARAVRGAVSDMLRMDAEAFLNCAYVRQGEVNKLIHASPASRQDMIDELLQLGRLEKYRDRATGARRGIATIRDAIAGRLEGIEDQIETKDSKDLPEQLNRLETTLGETTDQLEKVETAIEEANSAKDRAMSVLEQYEERREQLESVESAITDLQESIQEAANEREEVTNRIASWSDQRAEIQAEIHETHREIGVDPPNRAAVDEAIDEARSSDSDLQKTLEEERIAVQEHRQRVDQSENLAEELRERAERSADEADDLAVEIEEIGDKLSSRHEQLTELNEERDRLLESIEESGYSVENIETTITEATDRLENLQDREQDCRTNLATLEREIEEAERLLEAGKCPTCGQSVAEAPSINTIDEDREQLATLHESLTDLVDEREDVETNLERLEHAKERMHRVERLEERIDSMETLLAETEANQAEKRERLEAIREDAESTRDRADEAEERAASAREQVDEAIERVGTANEQREALRERIESLESLLEAYDEIAELDSRLSEQRTRRDAIDELLEERRDRLREKREERAAIAEKTDEERVEGARDTLRTAEERVSELTETHEELTSDRDSILDRLGRVRNEIDELEELRDRRTHLTERLDSIEVAHADARELESAYVDIRSDLRKQNVTTLERLLNETFGLVYQNDAYERIELDREYRFTVYQKDGETLRPEQLSGGERALFNLSLRCAIYRLLAEGIDGTAPLPPLILDEPTVYLDEGHVGKLVELIDSMRSLGVEQIIVVSHDRELLRTADVTLNVRKNPTTNRSTVTPESPPNVTAHH